jgi:hypothetical protein
MVGWSVSTLLAVPYYFFGKFHLWRKTLLMSWIGQIFQRFRETLKKGNLLLPRQLFVIKLYRWFPSPAPGECRDQIPASLEVL